MQNDRKHFHASGRSALSDSRTSLLGDGSVEITASLDDTGSLACASSQIVELGTADTPEPGYFDPVDAWGVNQKGSLDPDAMGSDAPNGEVLIDTASATANDDAFEDLDALARTLDDLRVYPNGIACAELRNFFKLLRLDGANQLRNHD